MSRARGLVADRTKAPENSSGALRSVALASKPDAEIGAPEPGSAGTEAKFGNLFPCR
jgi:hypothetical protein